MSSPAFVASSRTLLATEVVGTGDPVVFLHANVCDRRMWRTEIEAVGHVGRAITYDRRGFGGTRAEIEDHSPVADLMAVLDAVAGEVPAILVGCSQGGKIAIDAVLQDPSRVRALVLIAPGVGGAPPPVYPSGVSDILAAQRAAGDEGDLDRVNAIRARLWLDGPLAAEGRVAGKARQLFLDMNGIVLRAPPVGAELDQPPAFPRLDEITVPTLIIWGDLDFPHIQDRCRRMVSLLPDARGHEMAGVAHLPSLERPAETAALVRAFVQHLSCRAR